MAYNWLKWFHGAVTDDKWPMVARKSGQPVAVVVAVWAALLECASQAEDRGSVEDFDAESMDAVLQVEDGACAAIVDALSSGKRPRIVDGRIAKWEARQEESQDPTGRERKRRERERKRRERDNGGDCPSCGHDVTPDNVTKGETGHTGVTPSGTDQIRLDKTRDLTTPQDIPGYQDRAGAREEADGGCGEDYLDAPNVENAPSIEFQEIRAYFNAHGREEAPLTGFQEYLSLHATRQWPGQSAIYAAIDRLSTQDGPWLSGKAPGLARFFKEQWWRMPARKARASPLAPPGQTVTTVTERNAATAMQVLAEMEAENGN